MSRGRFIYLAGADGTGKSTHARLLIQHLQERGVRCRRLWLRFPFLLSLPLLAYARWRGYSWHEVTEGVDHGYWDFSNSRLMGQLFPMLLLVDAALASFLKVYLPLCWGYSIVCERYVLDMVVDLHLATSHPLPSSWELRRFSALLPENALIIGIVAPERVVIQRRPDLQYDHRLGRKLSGFATLFRMMRCPVIETVGTPGQVFERLKDLVLAHFGDS